MKLRDGGELPQAIEPRMFGGIRVGSGRIPVDRRAIKDGGCEIVERTVVSCRASPQLESRTMGGSSSEVACCPLFRGLTSRTHRERREREMKAPLDIIALAAFWMRARCCSLQQFTIASRALTSQAPYSRTPLALTPPEISSEPAQMPTMSVTAFCCEMAPHEHRRSRRCLDPGCARHQCPRRHCRRLLRCTVRAARIPAA
jgi:hypothetical protein